VNETLTAAVAAMRVVVPAAVAFQVVITKVPGDEP
jgi:hypothetical protein